MTLYSALETKFLLSLGGSETFTQVHFFPTHLYTDKTHKSEDKEQALIEKTNSMNFYINRPTYIFHNERNGHLHDEPRNEIHCRRNASAGVTWDSIPPKAIRGDQ